MLELSDYFKVNNKALSRSKVSDFNKSKDYFYRKQILGTVDEGSKKCYVNGTIVDTMIAQEVDQTMSDLAAKDNYYVHQGDFRSKADRELRDMKEAEGFVVIKEAEYQDAMAQAIAVEETDAYRNLEGYTKQMLLQMPWKFENGLFDKIVALPDFIKLDWENKHADIKDLKTTAEFDIEKWFYKCKDFNYFDQFAMSQIILISMGYKSFTFGHLIVVKNKNINDVFTVEVPNDLVDANDLFDKIQVISNTTDFSKYNPTWENALILRDPRNI